jgi:hypothetical protein
MSTAQAVALPVRAEAPARVKMLGGSHMAEALRRLPNLDRVPKGCHALRDWHLGGAYVVVDPTMTTMEAGETFAIRWSEHRAPSTSEIRWAEARNGRRARWMIRTPFVPDGLFAMGDDLSEASFARHAVGKVVGILCNRDGMPMLELWSEEYGKRPDTIDTATLPDRYAMKAEGDCLMPVFATGTTLLFSSTDRRRVGDFVGIWRKPELTGAKQYQTLVKRLLTPVPRRVAGPLHMPPVILVETLNPRRTWVLPMDQVAAVHRCLGECKSPTYPIGRAP